MATPNMNITEPTDHGSNSVWGAALNAALDLIDAHDHTTGKGVKIPSAALNINADVSWASSGTNYAITDLRALDFTQVASSTVTALADALFVDSNDSNLYFRNHTGTNVQITSGTTLNVSIVGGIGGDYASISALLDYDDASDTYRLRQQVSSAVRQFAKISSADLNLFEYKAAGNATVPTNAVTLKSPSALAGSYTLTMPAALPSSTSLMQMSSTGVLSASNTLPNNTNLKLQGTGYVQRGSQTMTIPIVGSSANTTATVATTAGTPGPSITTDGTVYFPLVIPGDLKRVISVDARVAASVANATVSLVYGVDSLGVFSAITGASGTLVSGGGMGITLTPSSPATLQAGYTLWLKIVTAGGSQVYCHSAIITADVP